MKNRIKPIHHLYGLVFAALVFLTLAQTQKYLIPNSSNVDQIVAQGTLFRTYSTSDYVGLTKIGIAKAMDRNAFVLLGYKANQLCSIQDGLDSSHIYKVISATPDLTKRGFVELSSSSIKPFDCQDNSDTNFAVTDSADLRYKLLQAGIKPNFVAYKK